VKKWGNKQGAAREEIVLSATQPPRGRRGQDSNLRQPIRLQDFKEVTPLYDTRFSAAQE
jgi:hypothetical protein